MRGTRSRMEKRREENYEGDHMAVVRRVTKECTIGGMKYKGVLKCRVTW